ncbi:MAG: hypothetical protein ABIS26_00275 [Candidatus Paceibacterota bacterium]
MKEISSKLKMHVQNVNVINHNFERVTLNTILAFFAALCFLYILLLGNMVGNIVERRSLELSVRNLSSDVSALELTYLSMSSNVDLNLSHSLGFKETKATFATRKSIGLNTKAVESIKTSRNDI